MSGFRRDEMFAPQIPGHKQDPVERRRLLNILAQRRYRSRQRESLQERNIRAEPGSSSRVPRSDGDEYQPGALDRTGSSENPPSQPGTLLAQQRNPYSSLFSINPLATVDRGVPSYPSPDIQATLYSNFGTSTAVENTLFSPFVQQGTVLDPLESAGHDPGSPISSSNLRLSARNAGSPLHTMQIEPTPVSAFGDYAITSPGLSVICAKVNLFNHIVGPGFSLDIWDPRALSPICLGAPTQPCPANFQPTPLQRRVPHHSIIDVFPWPLFRDRFLYTMSLPRELRPSVAQHDMPMVTLEVMMAAKDPGGGIRVWGSNAFLAENWEVGQTFYSKFWWALDTSIIRNSNQHRARRGEGNLRFDFLNAR